MENEYSNNPKDDSEIFSKLEAEVVDISCNMTILMETLENKFGPFEEFGSSKCLKWK